MINPAPYNAEAPPEAMHGEITPTELHYVRSNFAVPEHDGVLHIGGAVEQPVSLTLDDLRALRKVERAVTLEDRKSTRLNSSHANISYAVFCLKKKKVTISRQILSS